MKIRTTSKILYNFKQGDIIGSLIVLNSTFRKFKNRFLYWVKCQKCGKEFEKSAYDLKKGTQCTCKFKEGNTFNGYELISGSYFSGIRCGAKERGLEFNITLKEIWDLLVYQNFKCALSGMDISISPFVKDKWSNIASLDRKMSDEGYTIHNLQWVHKDVNRMKNHYSDDYFIRICKLIAKKNERLF